MWEYNYTDELYHYGVPGMKWGVHRSNGSYRSGERMGRRLGKRVVKRGKRVVKAGKWVGKRTVKYGERVAKRTTKRAKKVAKVALFPAKVFNKLANKTVGIVAGTASAFRGKKAVEKMNTKSSNKKS